MSSSRLACRLWSSRLLRKACSGAQNSSPVGSARLAAVNRIFETRGFCSSSKEPAVLASKMEEESEGSSEVFDTQKASVRHDLAMIFTCTICETRSAKTMSRASYETGVVIVRCPSCSNLHLIADHKGWFGVAGTVEDFLAQKGVQVRKGREETYQFTAEDLTAWSPPKQQVGES